MPKNNSDISREVERIRHEEALTKEIKRLRSELYEADKKIVSLMVDNDRLVSERDALAVINQQLQDDLEKSDLLVDKVYNKLQEEIEMLRKDNLQLIQQIGGGE